MLSSDDEHDELVQHINSKAQLRLPTATSGRPHTATSKTPIPFQPTSPFPLSASLPLPPPPPVQCADLSLDAQYLFLHKLDRKALSLLSSPDAATSDASFRALQLAVQILFHSLDCKKALYGVDSTVCLSHAELLIHTLNRTAMGCVQQLQGQRGAEQNGSEEEEAERRRDVKRLRRSLRALPLAWLKEAEQLCVAYPQLLAAHILTLNHLACCYRLVNKPRTAVRLLQEALRRATEDGERAEAADKREESKEALMEVNGATSGDAESRLYMRAAVSANLCAVLCQMECWEQAGLHAKLAVDLCQRRLFALITAPSDVTSDSPARQLELSEALTLLSHCYAALGSVELELHVASCLHWFEKAQAVEESAMSQPEDRRAVGQRWAGVMSSARRLMETKEAESRRDREMMRMHRPWTKVVSRSSAVH